MVLLCSHRNGEHVRHGVHNKETFLLSSDRIAIRLLIDLAIDIQKF